MSLILNKSQEIIDKEEIKSEALVIIVILGIISFFIIAYYIYVTYYKVDKNIINRFKGFYGISFSQLSLGLIIAFLISDVISAFNAYMMTPLVRSAFPGGDIWTNAVHLPRNNSMYPGLFFQSIIGFILSIAVLFLLVEIFATLYIGYKSRYPKETRINFLNLILYTIVVIVFVGLIIWNSIELADPDSQLMTPRDSIIKNIPINYRW